MSKALSFCCMLSRITFVTRKYISVVVLELRWHTVREKSAVIIKLSQYVTISENKEYHNQKGCGIQYIRYITFSTRQLAQ